MSDDFSKERYQALAEFRFQVRRFLRFSDEAARSADLEPQHHQMLLALMGSDSGPLTVGALADRLQIRPHSAAELVARAVSRGLVERNRGEVDQRQVFVEITEVGAAVLAELSTAHHRELLTAAPELIRVLQRIIDGETPSV
jgi:DNA-binding MarR family transcriptional regulator